MEKQYSKNIQGLVKTFANEINDVCKEYASEKISLESKKETIQTASDILIYRVMNSARTAMLEVTYALEQDKNISKATVERVKLLINGSLQ